MKKSIIWVLCGMLLMAGIAWAEDTPQTRSAVITLEGMEEAITETRFYSGRGYAIWYDAARFAPMTEDEGGGMDILLPAGDTVPQDVVFAIVPGGMLEADYAAEMAASIPDTLADNGYDVTPIDVAPLELPYLVAGYHGIKEGAVIDEYFLNANGEYFTVTLEYPSEAAEGYGARMLAMLLTFEPVPSESE